MDCHPVCRSLSSTGHRRITIHLCSGCLGLGLLPWCLLIIPDTVWRNASLSQLSASCRAAFCASFGIRLLVICPE
ncbi:rCG36029 [Rattus norvegicus]|uniref:RCG36029 n=1 Tax=Rattus norvegicus TaxID=10116 RepID=A6IKH0_RAT|nr:rCG36029 [Rattus norvegicus]